MVVQQTQAYQQPKHATKWKLPNQSSVPAAEFYISGKLTEPKQVNRKNGGHGGRASEVVYFQFNLMRILIPEPTARSAVPVGTNPPRLFKPGKTNALAKSKVHQ